MKFSIFARRSARKEYWLSVAGLILLSCLLAIFLPEVTSLSNALLFPWIMVWMWRLHDIGKSGWYAALPLIASALVVLAPLAFGGKKILFALAGDQAVLNDPSAPYELYAFMLLGLVLLIQMGFTAWLGWKPGDPAPNKFGPIPV